ncbi:MAG: transcriptional repressor [Betaproteobacteria bacterium]|nr:transcriptional repressor [Betaproteobacteria bacterium]
MTPHTPSDKKAAQPSQEEGARLTRLRRDILDVICAENAPVKAYDLIERMRGKGRRVTPTTMYRTLEFLLQNGFIHRVNFLNAYLPCTGKHKNHTALLLFVCSECGQTREIDDAQLYNAMHRRLNELGIYLKDSRIEIQAACQSCRASGNP